MKLIKYIAIVFISSATIAALASWAVKKGLTRSNVDFFGKMNAAGDATKDANIIMVGSSRTLVHLDPAVIDSVTGLKSYNYGLNAVTIRTCYNIIHYALKMQPHAKWVVLNIDYSMFGINADPYQDPYYYPFENSDDSLIMTYTGAKQWIHKLKLLDISMYDDITKYAAIDGFLRPGRKVPGMYKGYLAHEKSNDFAAPPPAEILHSNTPFSKEGLAILQSVIDLCRHKQVGLLLVLAPYAKQYFPDKYIDNFGAVIHSVDSIAQFNGIPFADYTTMPIAANENYFYNVNHLNSAGAKIYSLAVANSINSIASTPSGQ